MQLALALELQLLFFNTMQAIVLLASLNELLSILMLDLCVTAMTPSQGTVSSQHDYSVNCTQILAAHTKIKCAARIYTHTTRSL